MNKYRFAQGLGNLLKNIFMVASIAVHEINAELISTNNVLSFSIVNSASGVKRESQIVTEVI